MDAIALKKLVLFVNELMEHYFSAVQERVRLEVRKINVVHKTTPPSGFLHIFLVVNGCFQKETGDNTILVRSLDRFHRRLQAMNKLMPDTDFSRAGTEIVSRTARDRVAHYLNGLKQHFAGLHRKRL